jgi:antitoxin (DNA-binding transcriptional repressor) of toxin-antitoxin stability system
MVAKTIEVQEKDADLKELLALVREGAVIVLMAGDQPVARLTPAQPRIMGLHAHLGKAWTSDDFDEDLPASFWLGEG